MGSEKLERHSIDKFWQRFSVKESRGGGSNFKDYRVKILKVDISSCVDKKDTLERETDYSRQLGKLYS